MDTPAGLVGVVADEFVADGVVVFVQLLLEVATEPRAFSVLDGAGTDDEMVDDAAFELVIIFLVSQVSGGEGAVFFFRKIVYYYSYSTMYRSFPQIEMAKIVYFQNLFFVSTEQSKSTLYICFFLFFEIKY